MVVNNHMYNLDRRYRGIKGIWRCNKLAKLACRATIVTMDNHIVTVNEVHNHPNN